MIFCCERKKVMEHQFKVLGYNTDKYHTFLLLVHQERKKIVMENHVNYLSNSVKDPELLSSGFLLRKKDDNNGKSGNCFKRE